LRLCWRAPRMRISPVDMDLPVALREGPNRTF